MGDVTACASGPPGAIVTGGSTVLIGGLPAARVTDFTAHGGTIVIGFELVQIGVAPQAAALRAASEAGAPFCEPCP